MLTRVLVAMDDSEVAEQALRYALEVHPEADVTVLTVVGGPSGMLGDAMSLAVADDFEESANERARPVLERARAIAAESEREIDTEVGAGHPAREILDRAEDFETIVVGSHGDSLADRVFVGNVADKVVRGSPVPVTVVR
jgi:nucleotide-binding universal stress UspA family protein